MKLVLKHFICNDATDDPGGDSPYFVIFVGHPKTLPTGDPADLAHLDYHVVTVWKAAWDDAIQDGTPRSPNLVVKSNSDHKTLHIDGNTAIIVALCEQDDNVDITADERLQIKQDLINPWIDFGGIIGTSDGYAIARKMRTKFRQAIDDAMSNDDILGVASMHPTFGPHHLNFVSKDDAYDYAVTFSLED